MDYFEMVCNENAKMQEFVIDKLKDVHQKCDEISATQTSIHEMQNSWDQAIDDINKTVIDKAIEWGLVQKLTKINM